MRMWWAPVKENFQPDLRWVAWLQAADATITKGGRAAARGVARKALKVLSGSFLAAHPDHQAQVLHVLVSALVEVRWPKLWSTALKAARRMGAPLLTGLGAVEDPKAASGPEEAAALSRAVIQALASQASADREAAGFLMDCLASQGDNASMLLVLNAAVHSDGGAALAVLQLTAGGQWQVPAGRVLEAGMFDSASGLPSLEWLAQMGPLRAEAADLLLNVMLSAVKAVPRQQLEEMAVEVSWSARGRQAVLRPRTPTLRLRATTQRAARPRPRTATEREDDGDQRRLSVVCRFCKPFSPVFAGLSSRASWRACWSVWASWRHVACSCPSGLPPLQNRLPRLWR